MIAEEIFERWLDEAISFANLPSERTGDADSVFSCAMSELESQLWLGPESSYAELHRDWHKFLRKYSGDDGDVARLRAACVDWSMGEFGDSNVLTSAADVSPFGFDDSGRPQLGGLHARRPEGVLAAVGAELLAPDSTFGIRRCRAVDCRNYLMIRAARRGRGRTPAYCALHKNDPSARHKRYKKEHEL